MSAAGAGRGRATGVAARVLVGTAAVIAALAEPRARPYPSPAQASICLNPCRDPDGALCISLVGAHSGVRADRLVQRGEPVTLVVGRQVGTCGGLRPVPPDRLAVRIEASPDRGPAAAAGARRIEDPLVWTPPHAGTFYVSVATTDDPPASDRIVVTVVDPARPGARLHLHAGPPSTTKTPPAAVLRLVPPDPEAAERAGFLRRRWPTLDEPVVPRTERALVVPCGTWEVTWSVETPGATHLAGRRLLITDATRLDLTMPRPSFRLPPPGAPRLVEARFPDGTVLRRCVAPRESVWLHVPDAPMRPSIDLRWYAIPPSAVCIESPPSATPSGHASLSLSSRAVQRIGWPPSRSVQSAPAPSR